MTTKYPDSARVIWIKSFLAFASCGNAEQAEKELGQGATVIQRNIASLETWLGRRLITDDNPAELWIDGAGFVPVALEVWELIEKGLLEEDLSRLRVLSDGKVLRDGYPSNRDEAFKIGQLLLSCRTFIKPRTESEVLYDKANRLHRIITVDLLKMRGNITLYERSPPTRPRLAALASIRRRVRAGENILASLNELFGPFERVSGSSIDMSWWHPE